MVQVRVQHYIQQSFRDSLNLMRLISFSAQHDKDIELKGICLKYSIYINMGSNT